MEWASSPQLHAQLLRQQQIDPDTIFGPIAPLQLEDVFKSAKDAKSLGRAVRQPTGRGRISCRRRRLSGTRGRWGINDFTSFTSFTSFASFASFTSFANGYLFSLNIISDFRREDTLHGFYPTRLPNHQPWSQELRRAWGLRQQQG